MQVIGLQDAWNSIWRTFFGGRLHVGNPQLYNNSRVHTILVSFVLDKRPFVTEVASRRSAADRTRKKRVTWPYVSAVIISQLVMLFGLETVKLRWPCQLRVTSKLPGDRLTYVSRYLWLREIYPRCNCLLKPNPWRFRSVPASFRLSVTRAARIQRVQSNPKHPRLFPRWMRRIARATFAESCLLANAFALYVSDYVIPIFFIAVAFSCQANKS